MKRNRNHKQHGGGGHKKKDKGFVGSFLKHPGSFVKPLTPKRYARELRAERRLEFGPEKRAIQADVRANRVEQQRIPGYFDSYLADLKKLQGETTQAYDKASSTIQGEAQSASDYAEKLRQKMRSEDKADAAVRGATYDPSTSQTATEANLARRNTANAFGGLVASQGANQSAYFTDKRRIGKATEIDQLLKAAARGRTYSADRKDLAGRMRAFAADYRAKSRPQERDFYLGLLQARLGQKQAKLSAKTTRRGQNISAATSRRGQDITASTSIANSRRTYKAAIGNLRERVRHDQITEAQAKQQEARLRKQFRQDKREFRQTHTKGGKSKGTVGSSDSGSGAGGVDRTHVQHMISTLRLTSPEKLRKWDKATIIAKLMSGSTTYTRREAEIAYRKWRKNSVDIPKLHPVR